MYSLINSQDDVSEVITLPEAKRQCRIMDDDTLDDDDLTALISVAVELAQTYTHRLMTPGSVSVEVENAGTVVQLPWGNVSEITNVIIDGQETTDYTFSEITQKLTLNSSSSVLQVTFNCGYSEIPHKVKQGVLMLISTLFNNRDDFISGMTVEEIPLKSRILLDSVRYYIV